MKVFFNMGMIIDDFKVEGKGPVVIKHTNTRSYCEEGWLLMVKLDDDNLRRYRNLR